MNPASAVRRCLSAVLPLLLAAQLGAAVGVSVGDLITADAGTDATTAALIQVLPGTGSKITLTGNGSGSGAVLDTPRLVAVASPTAVYYYETAGTNAGKIVALNPTTGARSLMSGDTFPFITAMAWNAATQRLLIAYAGTTAAEAGIFSGDPATGTFTPVTVNGAPNGATLDIPRHLACSPAGAIYYAESQDATNVGKIVSVAPVTGMRTVVAGSAFTAISALNWDAVNSKLIVADAGTSASNATIYRVDPANGTRTTITGNGTGSGATLDTPRYVATATNGAIYYYESADATNLGKVVSVVPATGARTALASTAYTTFAALSVVPSVGPAALGNQASVTAANTLSYTVAAGNNRVLVVTASHADNGGAALTSVTFDGQPLLQAAISTDTASAIDSIWTLALGSSATPTTALIIVTPNAGASTRPCSFISAQTFKDVSQTSPYQTVAAANVAGGASSSTLTITSSTSDTVFDLIDTFKSGAGLTVTAGSGQTVLSDSGIINLSTTGIARYSGNGQWKTSTKGGTGATTATSWTTTGSAFLAAAISLKAAPAATAPTVASPTKASITGTTATLGANVTADGGTPITKRGIVYAKTSLNSNPTVGGTNVTEVDHATLSAGSFGVSATDLSPSTGYSYAGFAVNSTGTTYTSVDTFTTDKALVSIAVTPSTPSVAKGATQQFTATATYSDTSTADLTSTVTWSSSSPSVATISNAGLATGAGAGSTTITATSGVVSGTATLTVIAPPTIAVAFSPATIPVLGTTTITYTLTNPNATALTGVAFTNTLPAGLTPAATPNLSNGAGGTTSWTETSVSLASATIPANSSKTVSLDLTATTVGTKSNTTGAISSTEGGTGAASNSATLTVNEPALVSLAVTPAGPSIVAGDTQQFTATGTYDNAATQDLTASVTWGSSDTTVATISNVGLATSLQGGTSTITATSGAISGSTTLTVTAPPAPILSLAMTGIGHLPAGTTVGTGTVNLGSAGAPITLTISNTGNADLTLGALTVDGANAADFAVSTPASTTLAPAASTTVTVTFTPGGADDRTAQLHLASNDEAQPYTVTLTGAGFPPTGRQEEGSSSIDNSTSATATPLSLSLGLVKVHGNLFPNGDVDYYSFTAQAGDRIYAATMTTASAAGLDNTLTLLGSDGTTIEVDHDDGSLSAQSSSIAGATIPNTGTYYLKVNDGTTTPSGSTTIRGYDLYLQVRSGTPVAETEPNDTVDTPNPGANFWVSGARDPASIAEQDWHPVMLNAGDTVFLSLDLDPERDGTNWNGRLGFGRFGDANIQTLIVDDAGTGDTTTPKIPSEALFFTVKDAGIYYAMVDSGSAAVGGPTSTYHLNISVLPEVKRTWTTYTSTDVPKTIGPGTGLTSSTITVPGHPRIAKIRLKVNLNHAVMAEIDAHLRSPAGNDIGLFTDVGSTAINGQTQMDLILDDDAAIPPAFPVMKGVVVKPEAAYRLYWLNGEDAGGTWTLDLRDDATGANGGTLNSWSIELVEEPTPAEGTVIFSTDFESGAAGFTHSGAADEWELGTPATLATSTANPIAAITTANSGVNCWKTDLDGTYNNAPVMGTSITQELLSPNISLAGATGPIRLTWAQKYQFENATFDHAYVEVRQVGGAGARKVWEWLDGTMTDSAGNPTVNIGASAGWAVMNVDISDFAGQNIEVRFHFDSDNTVNFAGWAIDDFAVIGSGPSKNANLSALTLSAGTLSPAFSGGTLSYTASVPYETGSITLTPTAAESHASIVINSSAITSGTATGDIGLDVGANTITILGIAQDGTTTATYTVTVTRAEPTILVSPSTLPNGQVSTAYGLQAITASSGIAPYTITVTAVELPPGLVLTEGGAVTGTPTASGLYSFTLRATDSSTGGNAPYFGEQAYTVLVVDRPMAIEPTSTAVTGNSVTLGGNISSDGSSTITERGIVYAVTSVNANPTLDGEGVIALTDPGTTGAFTIPIENLVLDTMYSYAIYATNSLGTTYSAVGTFTTGKTGTLVDTTQGDFEAGVGTNVDTTTSPDDIVLGAGGGTLDQASVLPTTDGTAYLTNEVSWAQTFTPAVSGTLTGVALEIHNSSNVVSRPDINVSIRTVSAGIPTGIILATGTIDSFSSAIPTYYTVTFSTPPVLVAGTQYAIYAQVDTVPPEPYFIHYEADSDSYAGGNAAFFIAPNWAPQTGNLAFRTYMAAGAGTFTSELKDSHLPDGKTHWTTLSWSADTPAGTSVKFQVATGDAPDSTFTFVGPDGTAATYFTDSGASLAQFYGPRYLKYRAFLATDNDEVTPVLHDVTVGYDLAAPPTVSATAATDVTGVSATLGGNVTFDGGADVTARGIVLSPTATNAEPMLGGEGVITLTDSGTGTGTFTALATGLAKGTGYSYAAYATNEGGTGYSSVATFTTVADPVITSALTAAGTYGSVFEDYTLTASASPSSYTVGTLPAGLSYSSETHVISGTPTATGTFNVAVTATNVAGTGNATLVITVNKAILLVSAEAKTKVYGAANPTATATISGFVLGQIRATSDVTGQPGLSIDADLATPVGLANISATSGTLASQHYAFEFEGAKLTITKAALNVTADPKSRVYGSANPALTATITGFVNGQNLGNSGVSGSPAVTSAAVANTPVGPIAISVATGNLSAANYSFNLVPGTLTITKAVLTVTADPKVRTYGAAEPTFTGVITGYVNSQTISVVSGTPAYSTNATATSPIGAYVITPALGSLSATNYSFSFAPGALTINPATLTIVVNSATKVYGSDNPTLTARYVGYLNGENDSVVSGAPVLSTTALKTSPAGNYPITVTAGTLSSPNYVFNATSSFSSNILTVTKAPLTVRAVDQSRAYGAANATPSASYSGFVLGESTSAISGSPTLAHTATQASPIGSYDITITAGTLAAANYTFTLVPGTLTVGKASLTVTADAKTKVYGAVNPALTATITGFANGETTAVVSGAAALSTDATTGSNVGEYTITPAVGTLTAANYSFGTFNNGTLTVTASDAAVTLSNLSQTYDGQPKPVTVTTTPDGLATTVHYGDSLTVPTNAGSYGVTATLDSANYSGSARGTLVIAQAAQTITFPAPAEVTVGLALTLTATASSGLPVTYAVVSGNASVNGSAVTVADNSTVVLRATQAGNDNYLSATQDLTLATATLKEQTITFTEPESHLTTDAPFTLSATASSGLAVTFTYVSGPASLSGNTVTLNNTAGTVVIRASQAGNTSYSAAPDVTRSITVTAKGPQVFFGGFGSKGIKDVSAQAVAVGGGLAANLAPDGEDSTLIGYLPESGDAFVLKFRLAADGSFSATTTSIPNPSAAPAESRGPVTRSAAATALAAVTLTFHGQVSGGILSGVIDELSLPFSAEIQPEVGTTVALAGFYQAAPLNSASGNIYSIVSADGDAFVLAITPAYVGGGTGTVDTSGSFTVSTPNSGVVSGSVDAVSTSVTGTLALPSQPVQNFAGVSSETARTDRLVNLSTRGRISANAGDKTLITGFVIGGTAPKQVLLRAVGPTLANYGVQNPAADPQLIVYDRTGQVIAQNNDWADDSALSTLASNIGASPLIAGSKDAAVALTLSPGVYSMHVITTTTAGVALSEIYDAGTTPEYQRLLNISSRGPVSGGEDVLIAGFVVTGNSPKRVLIRGAGPGLAAYNVSGVLADPYVRLYSRTGDLIAQNDNWETPATVGSAQAAATAAEVSAANTQLGAFAFVAGSKDAALIVVLAPGIYSAQVSSANGGTGNALVEIYEIP